MHPELPNVDTVTAKGDPAWTVSGTMIGLTATPPESINPMVRLQTVGCFCSDMEEHPATPTSNRRPPTHDKKWRMVKDPPNTVPLSNGWRPSCGAELEHSTILAQAAANARFACTALPASFR